MVPTAPAISSSHSSRERLSTVPCQYWSFPIHIQTPGAVLLFMKCEVMRRRLCSELSNLSLDALLLLSLGQLGGAVLLGLSLPVVLGLLLASLLILLAGVGADLLVSVFVELLKTVGLKLVIDVARELSLVGLLAVVGESLHVLSDVAGEDVLAEGVGVELLGVDV